MKQGVTIHHQVYRLGSKRVSHLLVVSRVRNPYIRKMNAGWKHSDLSVLNVNSGTRGSLQTLHGDVLRNWSHAPTQ